MSDLARATRRPTIALLLSLLSPTAVAVEADLVGSVADWGVRTVHENDRISVASSGGPAAELRVEYELSTPESWVSTCRDLPAPRDFSDQDGFRLRLSGDPTGIQLHVDLVGPEKAGFLRWTTKLDQAGWRELWIGQGEFNTHGTPTLSAVAAVRLTLEANGPRPPVRGALVVGEWRVASPPSDHRPALAFDVYGQELVADKYVYVTDVNMEPVVSRHQYLSPTRLRIVPNSNDPLFVHILWRAPELGRVMAYADGGGHGFAPDGERRCLNLCLADTKVGQLTQRLDRYSGQGYRFSGELAKRVAELRAAWAPIRSATPDRWTDLASQADRIMGAAGCALETLELEKARADLERYGQRDVEVVLQTGSGQSLKGYQVSCRQVRRDFLMGAHPLSELLEAMERSEQIRKTAPLAFNLGIVPLDGQFHGKSETPVDPDVLWEQKAELLAVHRRLGLTPRGSICPFFTPGCVSWMRTLPFEAMLDRLARAVTATVERFRDEIDIWLVINEAHDWANALNLSHPQLIEVARTVVDATREADPGCLTIVNACLPWGEYVHWRGDDTQWTPFAYFKALNRAGVRYDVVGLQTYTGFAEVFPLRDLAEMSDMLDRYATLGKPIFITEVCLPSQGAMWGSWHGEQWNPQRQADYLEGLYTLAHGKPFVDAIRWFSFSDRQFSNGTGLVTRTMTEAKPSYERVIQLAQRWTTTWEATVGSEDETAAHASLLRLRGFLGDYELTVSRDHRTVARRTIHLSRGTGPQRVVVPVP